MTLSLISVQTTSSPIEIIIPSVTHSSQVVSLDNRVFTLEIKWNSRNESWYMSLYDAQEIQTYISGIKIEPNQNLTTRYNIPNLIRGNIFCIRTKNTTNPIGRDNFGVGKEYSLFYLRDDIFEGVDLNEFIQL